MLLVPGEKVCGTVKSVAYTLPTNTNTTAKIAAIFVSLNFIVILPPRLIEYA